MDKIYRIINYILNVLAALLNFLLIFIYCSFWIDIIGVVFAQTISELCSIVILWSFIIYTGC